MSQTIDEVRNFWDSSPLGVDFIPHEIGSREWFLAFDRVKLGFGLLDSFEMFAPSDLRGKKVLDVGCGPGFWARQLIRRGVEYTGIDISPRSVDIAATSLELFGLTGRLEVGNAEALPFGEQSFDAVVSEGVIHHTPNTQACIDEIWRVLRPGGRAAVSVYYRVLPLRSPFLFGTARRVMSLLSIVQRGRGRERMADAMTPDDFVRMYDGAANPVGRAYTKAELAVAFSRFADRRFRRYFLPYVRPLIWLPKPVRRVLSRMGLMMLVVAHK